MRLISFAFPGATVLAGSCRNRSGFPSCQRSKSGLIAGPAGLFGVSDKFIKTVCPALLGPLPSTHDTTNANSRMVRPLSFANSPYPGTARQGGMCRRSASSSMDRAHGRVSSYVVNGKPRLFSVWHATHFLFRIRTISRSNNTVVVMVS